MSDTLAPENDEAIAVRDFRIAVAPRTRLVWLREVSDSHQARIADLWWALYDEGHRTDVWHFAADPARTEGKALSNYLLDSVSVADNEVVFRVKGTMFRPGGAWWIVRKDFSFKAGSGVLALDRVSNVFGFFRGYDRDGTGGDLVVTTERPLQGRYEVREVSKVADAAAAACKFRDPQEFGVEWSTLESVARCLTRTPQAVIEYREFTAPSGAERKLRKGDGGH